MGIHISKIFGFYFMKVLFEYPSNVYTKLKNSNQHISRYNDEVFFIIGFLTKRELRRFHDIVEQIKMSNTDWMNVKNVEID